MAAIRSKDTTPELVVRKLVHGMGFRYRLHVPSLPGHPDLVFASRKKVILVHGCFWHMHECKFGCARPSSNADFWHSKRTRNVERDRENITKLKANGWSVLVVWECAIKKDAIGLARRLRRFLSS